MSIPAGAPVPGSDAASHRDAGLGLAASIVVCSYNRAESLRDTIAALRLLRTPAGYDWEVIVVDNNSRDHTRAVVEQAQASWPRLRYEFEGAQGLSHARNRGLNCARGSVILFTDDDVLPEPDWLQQTLAGFERYRADAVGGFIAPIWENPPPPWLTERFHGFLAIRADSSDDYEILQPGRAPFGANMAFRRSVFERVGLFDTSRGRKGAVLASGEDGDMFERILAARLKVVFLGASRVHHKVEGFRTTKRYFRRWRFQTSYNLATAVGLPGARRIGNIPLYLWPQIARALMRALWSRLARPCDEGFSREIVVWHFLGLATGLWQTRKARASGTAKNGDFRAS